MKTIRITVPSSKSLANRALVLAALTKGTTRLKGRFQAEDIQLMIQALRTLGIEVREQRSALVIQNNLSWRRRTDPIEIFVGNSGTCMRFLASLVALRSGTTVLRGAPRMHERPIRDLVEALRQLGVKVEYLGRCGYPPIRVIGRGAVPGGRVVIKGDVSSQFVSSLLLVGAAFEQGLTVEVKGELVSRPYVDMTTQLLKRFGISTVKDSSIFRISPTPYFLPRDKARGRQPKTFPIEGDASSAVYWWAFEIMHGVPVTVSNVSRHSIQPDAKFPTVAKALWQGKRRTFDMSDMPDAALMLMAMAAGKNARSLHSPRRRDSVEMTQRGRDDSIIIAGIGSLRVKECDRIEAMATELRRIGAKVKTGKDWIRIWPLKMRDPSTRLARPALSEAERVGMTAIKTYNDHRIAMSMAILGTKIGTLEIQNPDCVRKSYPGFWKLIAQLQSKLSR